MTKPPTATQRAILHDAAAHPHGLAAPPPHLPPAPRTAVAKALLGAGLLARGAHGRGGAGLRLGPVLGPGRVPPHPGGPPGRPRPRRIRRVVRPGGLPPGRPATDLARVPRRLETPDTGRGVRPQRRRGGAIEVGLRYSRLDLDHRDVRGGRQGIWTAGVAWYPVDDLRLMLQYQVGAAVPEGEDRTLRFQAVGLRLQTTF
jgi:hypothetical protein